MKPGGKGKKIEKKPAARDAEEVIRIHEDEDDIRFQMDHKQRYHMDRGKRILAIMGIVAAVLFFAYVILPNAQLDPNNAARSSLGRWMETLRQNVSYMTGMVSGGEGSYMGIVMVRFLVAAAAGAALSMAGAVYQGTFRNGLASPTTLGVQTGGVVGGAIYVLFFYQEMSEGYMLYSDYIEQYYSDWHRFGESLFILIGCFAAVIFAMVMGMVIGKGRMSSVGLILTGMVFSNVASGVIGLVQYLMLLNQTYAEKTYELRYMMTGTFSSAANWKDLAAVGLPTAAGLVVLLILAPRLNIVAFGEEEAQSLGLNIKRLRWILVIVSTVLTAFVIANCGSISFIGFMVPHIARRFIGTDNRFLIPGSALTGAILMMTVYFIGTTIGQSYNINYLTSLIGGAAFLFLLVRYRRSNNADWA